MHIRITGMIGPSVREELYQRKVRRSSESVGLGGEAHFSVSRRTKAVWTSLSARKVALMWLSRKILVSACLENPEVQTLHPIT